MPINEVFPRPLVKAVHFQVRFPQFFSLAAKIGDFQSAIMAEFPESNLLLKQQFMVVQRVNSTQELPAEPDATHQIWQFKNSDGVTVDVSNGSLGVSSLSHKTYSHSGAKQFRDVIALLCDSFFTIVRIPLIHRIGLRYVNECPLSVKTNERYRQYYDGLLAQNRFPLEESTQMETTVVVERNSSKLKCIEKLETSESGCRIILDLDAWNERIDSSEILNTADGLHALISEEFERFAKQDLLTYMRSTDGDSP